MILAAVAFAGALVAQDAAAAEPMACDLGPVTRTYGGSDWLVYGCSDGLSVVFVSAPGSPAMPFVFMMTADGEEYRLYGEGAGSQEATRPAYEELSRVSRDDLIRLREQIASSLPHGS